MAIKMIALDLDGTLLTSDKQISEGNKRALLAARQQGAYVVLTSRTAFTSYWYFWKN